MKDIVIFGAPGAGKGTQSDFIVSHYGLTHVSTGDLLRSEIAAQTDLGLRIKAIIENGQLVSDDIVVSMIDRAIAADTHGMLFDGFPRTVAQAQTLDRLLATHHRTLTAMVQLEVPEAELMHRLLERAKIQGRADDNEQTIANRLAEYRAKTLPVAEYYASQGKRHIVDGLGTIEQIADRIRQVLD